MKSSIALCTYNGERYLEEQLLSYCDQDRLPDELVVCDDGSHDSTRTILESFAKNAPFKVELVFNQQNLGLVRNFENAISRCSGDVIFLSDQDDFWCRNKVSLMVDAFEASDEIGMVYSDASVVNEELRPTGKTMWGQIKFTRKKQIDFQSGNAIDWLLRDGHVLGSSMAFRSKLMDKIVPIPTDIRFIHDNWIALVASCLSRVKTIDKPLIKYRQHSGQYTSGLKQYDASKFETLLHTAQRVNEYEGILKQLEILLRRLQTDSRPSEEVGEKITAARSHFQMRADLPDNLLLRIGQIRRELSSGRYHRFSNGLRSAAKDALNR